LAERFAEKQREEKLEQERKEKQIREEREKREQVRIYGGSNYF